MDEQLLSDDEIKELTKNDDEVSNAEEIVLTREERDALGENWEHIYRNFSNDLICLVRNKKSNNHAQCQHNYNK